LIFKPDDDVTVFHVIGQRQEGRWVMSDIKKLFADGLFKGFAPDETEAFLRRCQEKSYTDGSKLFKEQDEATKLYMILSGGIDLHFEMSQRENVDTIIASLKPGDAVGWSAIVPPHNYRLSG
jgi:CRP-like cAMP-binding protein